MGQVGPRLSSLGWNHIKLVKFGTCH